MMRFESGSRDIVSCAFCREQQPQIYKEGIERARKRMAVGDADAFQWMADIYYDCEGVPHDGKKTV